jgi:hypothetical protein
MMAQVLSVPQNDQDRPYTLLSIGGHALLLPQREMGIMAPVQDIKMVGRRASGAVGWLSFMGRRWPVYCLDEAWRPRPHLAPGQRICALVKLGTDYFGLVCAHVALVPSSALHICPVPAAMAIPDAPFHGLSRYADSVALVSTASALAVVLGVSEVPGPRPQAE